MQVFAREASRTPVHASDDSEDGPDDYKCEEGEEEADNEKHEGTHQRILSYVTVSARVASGPYGRYVSIALLREARRIPLVLLVYIRAEGITVQE